MNNRQAASTLDEIAELLDILDESTFRVRAYERAAQVVRGLPQEISTLDREGKLIEVSGIGKGIAERLHELLTTGKMTYLEELKTRVPGSLATLVHVPGLGPKKAKLVYEQLGIATLEELKTAAAQNRLRELPGMGAKSEENIIRGLELLARTGGRLLLSEAVPVADKIIEHLERSPESLDIAEAGSLRRRVETIGDIDILCSTKAPLKIAEAFCGYREVERVLAKGTTKCSILIGGGLRVDLRLVKPDEYGAALQYFTGSKRHNIRLREIAKKRGLKVSEYGVFQTESGRRIAGRSESDVYEALDLPWIDPALREDRGEIEAAKSGNLPNLIMRADIRGDLHVHTRASDGQSNLREMAEVARALKYEYLAISDHALELKIAGGLSMKEFEKQWEAIDRLNREFEGFKILRGVELNIDSNGGVDFPADFLARYDLSTASVHTGFNQDRKRLTERILSAIRNPLVNVIGHPTGRVLGRRDPYDVDIIEIFEAAAKTGTILELNAFPDRLDLNDEYLLEAKKRGCRFAVNTDAHHSGQLEYVRYGVDIARRGWLEKADVINTLPLHELQLLLGENRM